MKKTNIIWLVVVLVVIVALAWFFTKGSGQQLVQQLNPQQTVSTSLPTDIVAGFYDQWLTAAQQPTTTPSLATLAQSPILSPSLRTNIANVQKTATSTTIDPVLCQAIVPAAISTRTVVMATDTAQILVTSRDTKVTNQALVLLNKLNGGWYINDIQCSLGEFAPVREYSFEQEGYLLHGSIPKPYDPKNWYLVFVDQNGLAGNVVPLFFDAKTQCTALDGTVSVCNPNQFTEATKVSVHAQMTETGADVVKMEFVK